MPNVNFASISAISGVSPITVNFLLSTIPGNISKVYIDWGNNTNQTVSWYFSAVTPATSSHFASTLPISADPGNVKNYTITKLFDRPSIFNKRIYNIGISAYDTIGFVPTAYEILIGPILVQSTSSQDFSNIRLIRTKYIDKNKMMLIFEDQNSGKVYPVFTNPNFDTEIAAQELSSVYLTLSSTESLILDDEDTVLVLE